LTQLYKNGRIIRFNKLTLKLWLKITKYRTIRPQKKEEVKELNTQTGELLNALKVANQNLALKSVKEKLDNNNLNNLTSSKFEAMTGPKQEEVINLCKALIVVFDKENNSKVTHNYSADINGMSAGKNGSIMTEPNKFCITKFIPYFKKLRVNISKGTLLVRDKSGRKVNKVQKDAKIEIDFKAKPLSYTNKVNKTSYKMIAIKSPKGYVSASHLSLKKRKNKRDKLTSNINDTEYFFSRKEELITQNNKLNTVLQKYNENFNATPIDKLQKNILSFITRLGTLKRKSSPEQTDGNYDSNKILTTKDFLVDLITSSNGNLNDNPYLEAKEIITGYLEIDPELIEKLTYVKMHFKNYDQPSTKNSYDSGKALLDNLPKDGPALIKYLYDKRYEIETTSNIYKIYDQASQFEEEELEAIIKKLEAKNDNVFRKWDGTNKILRKLNT
jgi:hypothetical protein